MAMNNKNVIIERRRTVAKLKLQGIPQSEIAEMLGVSNGLISQDLKKVRAEWKESALNDMNEFIAQCQAKYELIEKTAWEAYLKSAEDYEQKMKKSKGKLKSAKTEEGNAVLPDQVESSTKTIRSIGNPRFLQEVRECIKAVRELRGTDAPTKVQVIPLLGADGKPYEPA